jgi:hypothetical protein
LKEERLRSVNTPPQIFHTPLSSSVLFQRESFTNHCAFPQAIAFPKTAEFPKYHLHPLEIVYIPILLLPYRNRVFNRLLNHVELWLITLCDCLQTCNKFVSLFPYLICLCQFIPVNLQRAQGTFPFDPAVVFIAVISSLYLIIFAVLCFHFLLSVSVTRCFRLQAQIPVFHTSVLPLIQYSKYKRQVMVKNREMSLIHDTGSHRKRKGSISTHL